jgi:hypothetical protein
LLANDFDASATAVAVRITIDSAGTGTELGAVYVVALPLAVVAGEMLPQPVGHGFPSSESAQLTPLSVGSLPMVAVNC